jgi:hypothetical protein
MPVGSAAEKAVRRLGHPPHFIPAPPHVIPAKAGTHEQRLPGSRFRGNDAFRLVLEHDPEKWTPVFGKDHAPTKN